MGGEAATWENAPVCTWGHTQESKADYWLTDPSDPHPDMHVWIVNPADR